LAELVHYIGIEGGEAAGLVVVVVSSRPTLPITAYPATAAGLKPPDCPNVF